MVTRSTPARSRCTAALWRYVCGWTRWPRAWERRFLPVRRSAAGHTEHRTVSSDRHDGSERRRRFQPWFEVTRAARLEGHLPFLATTDRGVPCAPWTTRSTTSNTAGTRDTFRVT